MKKLLFVLMVFLSCSSHRDQQTSQQAATPATSDSKHADLVLRADPRQGFSPLRITFHAELKGLSDTDATFHCAKEEWDFGDGAVSSQTPYCEPLVPGAKIERDYIVDHVYNDPGSYSAGFALGEKKLHSNKITVTVLENLRSPNGK